MFSMLHGFAFKAIAKIPQLPPGPLTTIAESHVPPDPLLRRAARWRREGSQ
jgi:hypothetical protein